MITKLLVEMEAKGIKQVDIVNNVKIKKSVVSKFLSNKVDVVTDIDAVLKIIRFVCPQREYELMTDYCDILEKDKQIIRAMEYCAFNRMTESLGKLIELANNKNKRLSQWAEVYSILFSRQNNESCAELLRKVKSVNTDVYELAVLTQIIECTCLYEMKHYDVMRLYLDNIEDRVADITDEFIRNSYKVRAYNLLCNSELIANANPEMSRNIALNALELEMPVVYKATFYETIGLSYIFENFEKCREYLNRSMSLFSRIERKEDVASIKANTEALAYNLHGKKNNEKNISVEERAHYLHLNGNTEEAIELINTCDLEDPHNQFYKGLFENDDESLFNSLRGFRKQGDNFFATLPFKELTKRGYAPFILNAN